MRVPPSFEQHAAGWCGAFIHFAAAIEPHVASNGGPVCIYTGLSSVVREQLVDQADQFRILERLLQILTAVAV